MNHQFDTITLYFFLNNKKMQNLRENVSKNFVTFDTFYSFFFVFRDFTFSWFGRYEMVWISIRFRGFSIVTTSGCTSGTTVAGTRAAI